MDSIVNILIKEHIPEDIDIPREKYIETKQKIFYRFFIMIINGKSTITEIIKNIISSPLNIATLLGFIFLILNIPLPNFILVSTSSIASIAPPLALLILGGTLDLSKFKLLNKEFLFALINRLIIIPFALLFILLQFNLPAVEIGTLVIFFATPVAVITFSFTLEYKANTDLASSLIVVSTLLSSLSLIALVTVMQIVFN